MKTANSPVAPSNHYQASRHEKCSTQDTKPDTRHTTKPNHETVPVLPKRMLPCFRNLLPLGNTAYQSSVSLRSRRSNLQPSTHSELAPASVLYRPLCSARCVSAVQYVLVEPDRNFAESKPELIGPSLTLVGHCLEFTAWSSAANPRQNLVERRSSLLNPALDLIECSPHLADAAPNAAQIGSTPSGD